MKLFGTSLLRRPRAESRAPAPEGRAPAADVTGRAKEVGRLLAAGDHAGAAAAVENFLSVAGDAADPEPLDRLLRGAIGRAGKLAETESQRVRLEEALAALLETILASPRGRLLLGLADDRIAVSGAEPAPRLRDIRSAFAMLRAWRAHDLDRAEALGLALAAAAAEVVRGCAFLVRLLVAWEKAATLPARLPASVAVPPLLAGDLVGLAVQSGSPIVASWAADRGPGSDSRLYWEAHAALAAGDHAGALRSIAAIERRGLDLPQPGASELLAGLLEERVPADSVLPFFASAPSPATPFLMTIAAIALAGANRHREGRALVADAIAKERSRDAAPDLTERLDYLLALYTYVVHDAHRRRLPRHAADPAIEDWRGATAAALADPAFPGKKKPRLIDLLVRLEGLRGTGADAGLVTRASLAILAQPELRRDPGILARLASLVGKVGSMDAEVATAFFDALGEAVPPGRLTAIAADPAAGTRGEFRAIIRVLEHAGRHDEIGAFAERLRGATALSPEARLEAARALLRTGSRRTAMTGALAVERLLDENAIDPASTVDAVVEAKYRLAKLDDLHALFRQPADLLRLGSIRWAGMIGQHLFGAAATAAFLRKAAASAAVRWTATFSAAEFTATLALLEEAAIAEFTAETVRQFDRHPQPARPTAVNLLVAADWSEAAFLPLLAVARLKAEGEAAFSLFAGVLDERPTAVPALNQLHAAVGHGLTATRWHREPVDLINDWRIDLPSRVAECRGLDLFPGLNESLGCTWRRYRLDYTNREVLAEAMEHIREMDIMIAVADRLKAIAAETGVPIRLLMPVQHLGWRFALRHYVGRISEGGDLAVFHATNGYDNYTANFASPFNRTVAVRNMTRHADLSNSYHPPVDVFEAWYRSEWQTRRAGIDRAEEMVRISRVSRIKDESRVAVAAIAAERKAGRKVLCLFGKVLFDHAVPVIGGPAHRDMKDWFDHTVAVVATHPELLLLVKPHPHELRDEISQYPAELLADWMPDPPPENVRFLPNDLLNLHEMEEVIDLGIVWNGSPAVELGVLGVPTVVCEDYGARNYPVGHIVPSDRAHYEWLLAHPEEVPATPEIADRCRAYLAFTQGPEVSTPYRYARRTMTNKPVRPGWFAEDLARYEREGDPFVEMIAARLREPWQPVASG